MVDGLAAHAPDVAHDPVAGVAMPWLRAIWAAIANRRPSSGPSASVRSAAEANVRRGSRGCGSGPAGAMSWNANTRSSSCDGPSTGSRRGRSGRTGSRPGHRRSGGHGRRSDASCGGRVRSRTGPTTRSRASRGRRPSVATRAMAFSRSAGSGRGGDRRRRAWSAAWPIQRPSASRVSREHARVTARRVRRANAARASAASASSSAARRFFVGSSTWPAIRVAGVPGRGGVAEDVEAGEVERPDERDRAVPNAASSSVGKPTIDVRVDRDTGEGRADPLDDPGIVGRQVAPAHAPQHAVVARLERQVHVRQRPRRAVGPDAEQLVVDMLRLDGARSGCARSRSRRGSAGRGRRGSAPSGRGSRGARARTSRRRRCRR